MQIESLRIPKIRIALIALTFLSWTVEGPVCVVAHRITGLENKMRLSLTKNIASAVQSVCCRPAYCTVASSQY